MPGLSETSPQFTKSAATIADEEGFPVAPGPPLIRSLTVTWGEGAAGIYDTLKTDSFRSNPNQDAPNAHSSTDLSDLPGSAPGGRFWAWLGGQHLLNRDHPRQAADPAKLEITVEDVRAARQQLRDEARRAQERLERSELHRGPGRF